MKALPRQARLVEVSIHSAWFAPPVYTACLRAHNWVLTPFFLSLDTHRYPLEKYYNRVDELVKCLNNGSSSLGVIRVDPFMMMSFPDFSEYGGFLDREDISLFARGRP